METLPQTPFEALQEGFNAARASHFEPWPLRQAVLSALYPEA